ncbi:MAG: DUF4215 domain-containing protein [Myxococcales bacterium]
MSPSLRSLLLGLLLVGATACPAEQPAVDADASTPADTSRPGPDAQSPADSGAATLDASVASEDASVAPDDAASPTDASTEEKADAAAPPDAGLERPDAGAEPDACVYEGKDAFCLGRCGLLTGLDQCGDRRTESCGGCGGATPLCDEVTQVCDRAACGNGILEPGEACDDGNPSSGDGSTGTCQLEDGWACATAGRACLFTVTCGDGVVAVDETCDDGNQSPGDGCDAQCHFEPGWRCPKMNAPCVASECGDGIVAGDEQCDDGNPNPGDGCSNLCRLATGFKCPTPGQWCTPTVCGDGVAEGTEACDDGNSDLGDGCTPFCRREPDCTQGRCTSLCGDGLVVPGGSEQCDDGNRMDGDGCSSTCQQESGFACAAETTAPSFLELPLVIRDFTPSHPDFEKSSSTSDTSITGDLLGPDSKPVYANPGGTTPTTTGKANFDQWYRDVPGVNLRVLQTLSLSQLPSGQYRFASNTFFPIDGQGFGNYGSTAHNFHFTTETRSWFLFQGGEQIDFYGDDDLWVYVNSHKAIDLGGLHGAQAGSIVLDVVHAATFGLVPGGLYSLAAFHAERHTSASVFQLTFSQVQRPTVRCKSDFGDGIKTYDEVCDDGVNDGSYGGCTSAGQLAPRCGDALPQPGEDCDDGVNLSPYGGCAPGCRKGHFCGDGIADSAFGEQCDDAVNAGGYGRCQPGCVLGPRCGDGIIQSDEGEVCDDWNAMSGDGCDEHCQPEP